MAEPEDIVRKKPSHGQQRRDTESRSRDSRQAGDQISSEMFAQFKDPPELDELCNAASEIADMYHGIGIGLKILPGQIKSIESDYHSCKRRLSEVFVYWKCGETLPYTWETFARVLLSPNIDQRRPVKELHKKLSDKLLSPPKGMVVTSVDSSQVSPEVDEHLLKEWSSLVADITIELNKMSQEQFQRVRIRFQQCVRCKRVAQKQHKDEGLERLVISEEFEKASNIAALFAVLAKCWNWLEYEPLKLAIELSECESASKRLEEFLKLRNKYYVHVPVELRQPTPDTTVGNGVVTTPDSVVEAKLDRKELPVSVFDQIKSLLCGATAIPNFLWEFIDAKPNCIVVRWMISRQWIAHAVHNLKVTKEVLLALAEMKVTDVKIGTSVHIIVPTLDYWKHTEAKDIFEACAKGDLTKVNWCLQLKVDVNAQDEDSRTGLSRACSEGHTDVVNILLEEEADPNIPTNSGVTPLMYASSRGHLKVVVSLIAKGARLDLQTKRGSTAVMKAANKGYTDIVEILLRNGADVDKETTEGITALMEASSCGHSETVNMLLSKRPRMDVNKQDTDGETSLAKASYFCYHDVVKTLLGKGANPVLSTKDGLTPLMLCVKTLDNPKLEEELGITREKRTKTIEILLAKMSKKDVNKAGVGGWTALFFAAHDGDVKYVNLLLECDADPNITVDTGKGKVTAMDITHSQEVKDILKPRTKVKRGVVDELLKGAVSWVLDIYRNRSREILLRRKARIYSDSEEHPATSGHTAMFTH